MPHSTLYCMKLTHTHTHINAGTHTCGLVYPLCWAEMISDMLRMQVDKLQEEVRSKAAAELKVELR